MPSRLLNHEKRNIPSYNIGQNRRGTLKDARNVLSWVTRKPPATTLVRSPSLPNINDMRVNNNSHAKETKKNRGHHFDIYCDDSYLSPSSLSSLSSSGSESSPTPLFFSPSPPPHTAGDMIVDFSRVAKDTPPLDGRRKVMKETRKILSWITRKPNVYNTEKEKETSHGDDSCETTFKGSSDDSSNSTSIKSVSLSELHSIQMDDGIPIDSESLTAENAKEKSSGNVNHDKLNELRRSFLETRGLMSWIRRRPPAIDCGTTAIGGEQQQDSAVYTEVKSHCDTRSFHSISSLSSDTRSLHSYRSFHTFSSLTHKFPFCDDDVFETPDPVDMNDLKKGEDHGDDDGTHCSTPTGDEGCRRMDDGIPFDNDGDDKTEGVLTTDVNDQDAEVEIDNDHKDTSPLEHDNRDDDRNSTLETIDNNDKNDNTNTDTQAYDDKGQEILPTEIMTQHYELTDFDHGMISLDLSSQQLTVPSIDFDVIDSIAYGLHKVFTKCIVDTARCHFVNEWLMSGTGVWCMYKSQMKK